MNDLLNRLTIPSEIEGNVTFNEQGDLIINGENTYANYHIGTGFRLGIEVYFNVFIQYYMYHPNYLLPLYERIERRNEAVNNIVH